MSYPHPVSLGWRVLEAFFHMADKLCLPGVLVFLNGILKPGTRRLSGKEQGLAHTVFGATIDYETVRVDERAWIACKRYGIAYVSFNVINCWGALSDAHFIHEMVHIWQYQRHGAVYIPRALWAQRTPAGYNYGGVEALQQALAGGKGFTDFNYEQQADIMADYFCLATGARPRWCVSGPEALPVFRKILSAYFPVM